MHELHEFDLVAYVGPFLEALSASYIAASWSAVVR